MRWVGAVLLAAWAVTSATAGGSCEEWFAKVRQKYHIAGIRAGVLMDEDGKWRKVFAKGTAAVDFDDEDEYEEALKEAELKAKAAIARFMKEEIDNDETTEKIAKTLKKLKGDGKRQSKTVDKKSIKTQMERIRNHAEALLRGVLVLCESIDSEKKRAVVVVGVSPKTQKAAESMRKSMNGESEARSVTHESSQIKIDDRMDVSDNLDF